MAAAGVDIVKHYRDLAFMGFVEVVRNLGTIRRNFRMCKRDILAFRPDAVVLVDYPGFNLRMAKWLHQRGIKVLYYISPKIWAWNTSRVKQIRRYVDKMYVILPFEEDFYARHGMEVEFVGHPLLDIIGGYRPKALPGTLTQKRPLIALLPGSRRQELERILASMLEVVPHFPQAQFVIAGAPGLPAQLYDEIISLARLPVPVIFHRTYDLLAAADAALVTSGTATLETAIFDVPQVVCYRASKLSYAIAKRVVKIRFISLVNLIMDREVVRELIQDDLNINNLRAELSRILEPAHRQEIKRQYAALRAKLGRPGAAGRLAESVIKYLESGISV